MTTEKETTTNDSGDILIIHRSSRRKKTIQARYIDGNIHIFLPLRLNDREEEEWIRKMTKRVKDHHIRHHLNSDDELKIRADHLNRRYFKGRLPDYSIRYVTNQNTRYGSCTPTDRSIRINHTLATMPRWVQDYVLIHELTHLIHPNHSKDFWRQVNEYPLTERARGYLIAKGIEKDEPDTE